MSTAHLGVPIEILLVDDDRGDATLTREALTEGKIYNIVLLQRRAPYGDAPRPDLVLPDLNLPRKEGHRIPVVILTTSGGEEDINRRYNLHANAYLQKPVDLDQFLHVVQSIDHFYLTVVRLPPR